MTQGSLWKSREWQCHSVTAGVMARVGVNPLRAAQVQQGSQSTMPGTNHPVMCLPPSLLILQNWHAPHRFPLNITLPPPPIWGIPPSRLRDMVYRLLEERSKKGAGRSMRALAWRVCAWVLPLYRNLEPITRKPLGGGSGDTSLQWRNGGEEWGSDLHCQAHSWPSIPLSHQL